MYLHSFVSTLESIVNLILELYLFLVQSVMN
jgi:hypothetical protein